MLEKYCFCFCFRQGGGGIYYCRGILDLFWHWGAVVGKFGTGRSRGWNTGRGGEQEVGEHVDFHQTWSRRLGFCQREFYVLCYLEIKKKKKKLKVTPQEWEWASVSSYACSHKRSVAGIKSFIDFITKIKNRLGKMYLWWSVFLTWSLIWQHLYANCDFRATLNLQQTHLRAFWRNEAELNVQDLHCEYKLKCLF